MFSITREGTLKAWIFNGYNFHAEMPDIPQDIKEDDEKIYLFILKRAEQDNLVARPSKGLPLTFNIELLNLTS